MPTDGSVTLIAGRKGSGKTFAANWLVRRARRLLVYDQTGHLHEKGPGKFDTFSGDINTDFKTFVSRVDKSIELDTGYREALVDRAAKHLAGFLRLVFMVSESPAAGRRPRHAVTVWFEEAHTIFPRRSPLPAQLGEMLRTARHRRLHFVFSSTKANDLPLELRELVDEGLIFQHSHSATLDYLGDLMGREWPDRVRKLGPRQFFKIEDTGEIVGPRQIRA